LKEYKDAYYVSYNTGIKTAKNIFEGFTAQQVYEYIYLYESRYPERERAFQNFFRKADIDLYLDDILKMKCMTYMLKNENITRKMLEYMGEEKGIYIKISDEPGTAYYTSSLLEGRFINYPHIVEVRGYNPVYKTYFHEFGHSIDHAFGGKKGYYSETFRNTQKAEEYTLTFNEEIKKVEVLKKERVLNKTIHEWAEFDVRNCLIETACAILNIKSTNTYEDILLAQKVINDYFFVYNGELRLGANSENIKNIYDKIKEDTEKKFATEHRIPRLPSDIFAGITGAQIGGGHGKDYWFYTDGKQKGERKTEVSMEAFAGYFEYTTLGIESAINPENVLHHTVLALEEMLKQIL
jgi:arsenate reductase-like glutaredoxin family protein